MPVRSFTAAGILLACLSLVWSSSAPVYADDGHLGEGTVLLVSVADWAAMKSALEASDQGRFLSDPEIRQIGANLKKGMMGLVRKGVEEATPEAPGMDPAEAQAKVMEFLSGGGDYLTALCEEMTGRAALSVGMLTDPAMPFPMPNIIFEFGGTDEIHAMHGQLLDKLVTLSEGEASKTTFTESGYEFMGIEDEGMGLFFGRKGDRFVCGVNKAGLADYLKACEAGTSRLGEQAFYKSALSASGRGHMISFVHLTPVWQLAMGFLATMPVSEGEPNPAAMIQALGLTDIQGMASSATWTPQGATNRTFVGMAGRRGLLRLVPAENQPLAAPPFAPSNVLSANTVRLELSQILNVIRDGLALAPPESKAEFEQGLAGTQEMFGFTLDELFGDFEGTIFNASPADAAPMNPMAMMMGGGAGMDFSVGLKLKSKERFTKLFTTIQNPELSQGMVTKQEVSGREVWAMMVPMGAAPMQITAAFEGDWLLIATGTESLKKSFALADSGENLGSNANYQKMVARVGGGNGMMVGYTDTGKSMAQGIEMLRPMLGMIPLFVPDMQQTPELLFLFDPANLPSGATIQKYFGETVTSGRIVNGGILVDGWSPSKSAPKKDDTKKSGAGL